MDIRFSSEDEAFRREVAGWLEDALTGEFAPLRGRGGVGDESAFVPERRAGVCGKGAKLGTVLGDDLLVGGNYVLA